MPGTVTVLSQKKTVQKNAIPARYPRNRSRNHGRFGVGSANQIAASSGVSAIQQSQDWSNGGKHPAQRKPVQIAASHGQSRTVLENQATDFSGAVVAGSAPVPVLAPASGPGWSNHAVQPRRQD